MIEILSFGGGTITCKNALENSNICIFFFRILFMDISNELDYILLIRGLMKSLTK